MNGPTVTYRDIFHSFMYFLFLFFIFYIFYIFPFHVWYLVPFMTLVDDSGDSFYQTDKESVCFSTLFSGRWRLQIDAATTWRSHIHGAISHTLTDFSRKINYLMGIGKKYKEAWLYTKRHSSVLYSSVSDAAPACDPKSFITATMITSRVLRPVIVCSGRPHIPRRCAHDDFGVQGCLWKSLSIDRFFLLGLL